MIHVVSLENKYRYLLRKSNEKMAFFFSKNTPKKFRASETHLCRNNKCLSMKGKLDVDNFCNTVIERMLLYILQAISYDNPLFAMYTRFQILIF
jgi:hypothetical protein